jgi:predicted DNA-binding transcriptional regulator AlpA
MRPLNLQEAAQFLRMSKSSLYQRKDIPRYRRPGSRTLLFDQDELEAWVMTGRIDSTSQGSISNLIGDPVGIPVASATDTLDIHGPGVYHRTRYR